MNAVLRENNMKLSRQLREANDINLRIETSPSSFMRLVSAADKIEVEYKELIKVKS